MYMYNVQNVSNNAEQKILYKGGYEDVLIFTHIYQETVQHFYFFLLLDNPSHELRQLFHPKSLFILLLISIIQPQKQIS